VPAKGGWLRQHPPFAQAAHMSRDEQVLVCFAGSKVK
jgi:hypothetical protein